MEDLKIIKNYYLLIVLALVIALSFLFLFASHLEGTHQPNGAIEREGQELAELTDHYEHNGYDTRVDDGLIIITKN